MEERGGYATARRTSVLARQLAQELSPVSFLQPSPCLAYQPPKFHSDKASFDKSAMRELLDGHQAQLRDSFTDLMLSSDLFVRKQLGNRPQGAGQGQVPCLQRAAQAELKIGEEIA